MMGRPPAPTRRQRAQAGKGVAGPGGAHAKGHPVFGILGFKIRGSRVHGKHGR